MADTAELDALIIRNLEEIEQGYQRITGDIERRLDKEAAKLFEEAAEAAGWATHATVLDDDFWLMKTDWQMEEGPPEEVDSYLVIRLEWDSKGPDVSWAQTFVGGQGSRLLLTIASDTYSDNKWLRFLKENEPSDVIKRLIKASGFRFEPDNKTEPLAMPVRIDRDRLAQAFGGEIDFLDALAPLATALREVVRQEALLDKLAGLAREADA